MRRPAPRPCESCPYRCDVPPGVWAAQEYDRLPAWDAELPYQPLGVFACHQADGRACAGWAGVYAGREMLGLRVAVSVGVMDVAEAEATADYVSPVPLFGSGAEAAEHGKSGIDAPGEGARRVVEKLSRSRSDLQYG